MITDDAMNVIQNVMDTHPEGEWINAAKKELPDLDEVEIIEIVMFLNVDVVDFAL